MSQMRGTSDMVSVGEILRLGETRIAYAPGYYTKYYKPVRSLAAISGGWSAHTHASHHESPQRSTLTHAGHSSSHDEPYPVYCG